MVFSLPRPFHHTERECLSACVLLEPIGPGLCPSRVNFVLTEFSEVPVRRSPGEICRWAKIDALMCSRVGEPVPYSAGKEVDRELELCGRDLCGPTERRDANGDAIGTEVQRSLRSR